MGTLKEQPGDTTGGKRAEIRPTTISAGQPLGTIAAGNGTKSVAFPGAVGGASDTTLTVALPAANKTGLSFGVAVRTAPGTVAHAGAIVHVMVSPVDPKTGRAAVPLPASGPLPRTDCGRPGTGSRRPEVALSSATSSSCKARRV